MIKKEEIDMVGRKFGGFGPRGHHGPHGPFGGFGPDMEFGGFRAGRGMMEPAILNVLLEKPMHGYEIISTLEKKSHGFWRPSAGSVYPTLQLLEEKEYVTSVESEGKKVFTLTDTGTEAAKEVEHLHEKLWKDRAETMHDMHDARQAFGEIVRNIRKIYHKGSDEQKEQLTEQIDHLKLALEKILAGEK